MARTDYGHDLTVSKRVVWVIARALVTTAAKIWFRYEVHGRENLPTSGAFILAPVHRSNLDTPLLPVIRKEPIRFMGKASLWETNRAADWFLTMLGGFPIDRDAADRSAMQAAEGILERGEALVMLFDGPSFVSGRQQVPIVPVGIASTEEAMPIGKKMVYPVKLVFLIGEPMAPPEQNENGRVPRRVVKEHTEELRLTRRVTP